MLRAVLTTALLATALAKGVAIGVTLGAAGAVCVRCACRKLRRPHAVPDAEAQEAG